MSEFIALLDKLKGMLFQADITNEELVGLQKFILKQAVEILKQNKDVPLPEADFAIGYLGVTEGDQFNIPPENAMAHLKRACENDNEDAALLLYFVHIGSHKYIPQSLRSESKGLLILEALAAKGSAYACYEMCDYHMKRSSYDNLGAESLCGTHRELAYDYAKKAHAMDYSGGYLFLGIFAYDGFYGLSPNDKALAYNYFKGGLARMSDDLFWECSLNATLYDWYGHCLFYGEGVGRNRVEGIKYRRRSADLGSPAAIEWLEFNKIAIDLIDQGKLDPFDYLEDAEGIIQIDVETTHEVIDTVEDVVPDDVNPMTFFSPEKSTKDTVASGVHTKKPTKH